MGTEGQPQHKSQEEITTSNNNSEQKEKTFEFQFFPDEKQRQLLGKAIEDVVDHVEEVNMDLIENGGVPNVIFLDKSARPFSVIFKRIWELKHPNRQNPHISFLNIGSELEKRNGSGEEPLFITPEIAQEIERIKIQYKYLKEAGAGSTVIIIDEIENSGFTREASLSILSKSFPNLKFEYKALVKARSEIVHLNEYDKNNPQLFDIPKNNMMGETLIFTRVPWASLWYDDFIVAPEGTSGAMDDDKTSLTSIPYYRHEKYSEKQKSERMKEYSKYKERLEKTVEYVSGSCREIVNWKPVTKIVNPSETTQEALKRLKNLKDECAEFLAVLPNRHQIEFEEFAEKFPGTIDWQLYSGFTTPDGDDLQKEIRDFLGFDGPNKSKSGSIARGIEFGYYIKYHLDTAKFQRNDKEIKISEHIRALRSEMKKIADEYWAQKIKE